MFNGLKTQENELFWLQLLEKEKPGLAPRCLYYDFSCSLIARPFIVTEFIENNGALTPSGLTDVQMAQVAKILASLHHLEPHEAKPELEDFNVIPNQQKLHSEFCGVGGTDGHEYEDRLNSAWALVETKCASYISDFSLLPRSSLIHGDSHCGNVLREVVPQQEEKLRFIDWEGAHVGCPLEDLGSFLVVTFPPLSPDRESLFLQSYISAASPTISKSLSSLQTSGKLETMLRLFKIRKLCRTLAFLNAAIKSMGGINSTNASAIKLAQGSKFFLSNLEANLVKL